MAHGDPTPGLGEGATLYAIFLSIKPCKALTCTVIDQHAAHLAELDREGRLVPAGPLLARFSGLIVLRVSSLPEAKGIAEADPMIRAGFQSYELAAWMLANKQNRYQPTAQMGGKS
jgi:uncharacterized protein